MNDPGGTLILDPREYKNDFSLLLKYALIPTTCPEDFFLIVFHLFISLN